VAAGQEVLDHRLLRAAKAGVAEVPAERLEGRHQGQESVGRLMCRPKATPF